MLKISDLDDDDDDGNESQCLQTIVILRKVRK